MSSESRFGAGIAWKPSILIFLNFKLFIYENFKVYARFFRERGEALLRYSFSQLVLATAITISQLVLATAVLITLLTGEISLSYSTLCLSILCFENFEVSKQSQRSFEVEPAKRSPSAQLSVLFKLFCAVRDLYFAP